MGSGEDAQFVFAKYDYTAQGNQVSALPCPALSWFSLCSLSYQLGWHRLCSNQPRGLKAALFVCLKRDTENYILNI